MRKDVRVIIGSTEISIAYDPKLIEVRNEIDVNLSKRNGDHVYLSISPEQALEIGRLLYKTAYAMGYKEK